jgi:hypothetical protein
LFSDLNAVDAHPEQVEAYLEEARKRQIALDTAKAALRAAEGLGDLEEVGKLLADVGKPLVSVADSRFVKSSLQELYESQIQKPGLQLASQES